MATFRIKRRTLGSDLRADELARQITDPDAIRHQGLVTLFTRQMVNTEDIEFSKAELKVDQIKAFYDTWRNRANTSPNDLFCWYLHELDGSLNDAWYAAYQDANRPLLPPEQKGSQFLSDAEKEALNDPENPTP
jgi:hypothetical protein